MVEKTCSGQLSRPAGPAREVLRYVGEGHTIIDRANVLHLWLQLEQWLKETMPPSGH